MAVEPEPPRDPSGAEADIVSGGSVSPDQVFRRSDLTVNLVRTKTPEGQYGLELIPAKERGERNLQAAFVDILALSGLPFETAFGLADAAWEIHREQMDREANPPELPKDLTPEEVKAKERWERMTPEEHEVESRAVWAMLEEDPDFVEGMRQGNDDVNHGRYYSQEAVAYWERSPLPELKAVREPSEVRPWTDLEIRIPDLERRMVGATQESEEGQGNVLQGAQVVDVSPADQE